MPRFAFVLLLWLALALAVPAAGQAVDLDAPAPRDPNLRDGRLENGLEFGIYRCAEPPDRVVLALYVGIGSLVEEESERGLAHFLEHMAFNGTTHYPAGELVKYLESIGAQFGADQNAYTTQDATVYYLRIPTDQEGAVDKGLEILADFAGGMTLADQDIEEERGVVLSEMLARKGAQMQMMEFFSDTLLHGSRYPERLPIGKEEVLEGFKPDTLRGFYKKWYRPGRMAVFAAGTLDPEAMEKNIRAKFAALPAGAADPLPPVEVPIQKEPRCAVFTHAEVPQTMALLVRNRPRVRGPATARRMRDEIHQVLALFVLNTRLAEKAREAEAPFAQAGSSFPDTLVPLQPFEIDAVAGPKGLEEALQGALVELQRMRQHPPSSAETERVRKEVVALFANHRAERAKTPSDQRLQELTQDRMFGRIWCDDAWGDALEDKDLAEASPADLQAAARDLLGEDGWVLCVIAPEQDAGKIPSAQALGARITAAWSLQTDAPQTGGGSGKLMEQPPAAGKVTAERKIEAAGITEWTLANGARVILKPTDFKQDQVLLYAWTAGGFADVPTDRYSSASLLATGAVESGLATHDKTSLDRLLSGRLVSVAPWVSTHEHGFTGACTPADLETALQLLHLRWTAPAFRPEAVERVVAMTAERVENELADPNVGFEFDVMSAAYGDLHWLRQPDEKVARAATREGMETTWREFYSDASRFSFYLVGAFEPDRIKALVETYLGSLSATSKAPVFPTYATPAYRFPEGIANLPVKRRRDEKCTLALWFPCERGPNARESARLDLTTKLLTARLLERLREKEGKTYDVAVSPTNVFPIPKTGRVVIRLVCLPEHRKQLTVLILDAIRDLGGKGPAAEELERAKKIALSDHAEELRSNDAWLRDLWAGESVGRPLGSLLERSKLLSEVTAKDVQDCVAGHLPVDHYLCAWLAQPFGEDEEDEPAEKK